MPLIQVKLQFTSVRLTSVRPCVSEGDLSNTTQQSCWARWLSRFPWLLDSVLRLPLRSGVRISHRAYVVS